MCQLGAASIDFGTIVASGSNAVIAHHEPTDLPSRVSEPTVIDVGACVGGYCSDITRTTVLGEPGEMLRKVDDLVLGAQLATIATASVGMAGEGCEGLARDMISGAGYREHYPHSLGYGVGLAVHEKPRVSPGSADVLKTWDGVHG